MRRLLPGAAAAPPPGRRALGAAFEQAAQRELERHGLRLRDSNVNYRFGEIDLVMDHGETLVFVEVRYRRGGGFGDGAISVDARKCRRIARAAAAYLAAQPLLARRPCRFDVVGVAGDIAAPRFDWIRNAFTLDEMPAR
ncbi:YraN family protein [Chiayiivirga flava]|uniref:YraN family protein n=1 Tax=Chiayiivirga flava TaxID=659595 RepID=UPI001FEB9C1F|nr:YraN family protein [Chiayiivirga flava]